MRVKIVPDYFLFYEFVNVTLKVLSVGASRRNEDELAVK